MVKRIIFAITGSLLMLPAVIAGTEPGHTGRESSSELRVVVHGFRNDDGVARIGLFTSAEGFPGDRDRMYRRGEAAIHDTIAVAVFKGLPKGRYAVSVYHDENRNGRLDKRWGFIPVEGFGVSRNDREERDGPRYDRAAIEVSTDSVTVDIRLEYLFGGD